MANTTVALEGTGTIAISATASENYITLEGRAVSLNVRLGDTNDGTFGIGSSSAGALVTLPKEVWIEVYRRDTTGNTGAKTIYFAADSGTPDLEYRVTG